MKIVKDDTSIFMEFGFLSSTRTIYVGEVMETTDAGEWSAPTDFRLADRVLKGLHILESKNSEPITMIVNNPGGDEYHGLAIYDAIKLSPCYITVKVMGHAMSMAGWFMQAADRRAMAPNATFMAHYGTWHFDGHSLDMERWAKENKRLNKLMEKHLLERIREKHPKVTRAWLEQKIRFDLYLDAHQTVELGLADEVLEYP